MKIQILLKAKKRFKYETCAQYMINAEVWTELMDAERLDRPDGPAYYDPIKWWPFLYLSSVDSNDRHSGREKLWQSIALTIACAMCLSSERTLDVQRLKCCAIGTCDATTTGRDVRSHANTVTSGVKSDQNILLALNSCLSIQASTTWKSEWNACNVPIGRLSSGWGQASLCCVWSSGRVGAHPIIDSNFNGHSCHSHISIIFFHFLYSQNF